jgi:two-component system sensor histidine kinase PilS (NtrC family)
MQRTGHVSRISDPVLTGRVRALIFGRVGVLFVSLLASWWWSNSFLEQSIGAFPQGLFIVYSVAALISAVHFALLETRIPIDHQLRLQFGLDALIVTGLVWNTGDVYSPFITLYIILVAVAGYFLSRIDTIILAVVSAALFSGLALSASNSFIVSTNDDQPVSRIVQTIAFNIIGILVVGLLSARLAERRRLSEELRYTAESFADLHILHERIVESIGSGLVTTDLDGRIFAFNRAAEEITGIPAAKAIGLKLETLFNDSAGDHIRECMQAVRTGQIEPMRIETTLRTASGAEPVYVECTATPLLSRDGGVKGLIASFQNVTKLRALEETVRRSDRLAAVGRMAAGLAHEIRNPLGSMSSALQFLDERTPRATEEATLMSVVLRESDRLNSIITNFLAYARPSANVIQNAGRSPVDVNQALRDCLALLTHSPEVNERHRFDLDLPDGEVVMELNETHIKQVFWNLLRNAVAAMPDGGTLSVSLAQANGSPARIRISDSGRGIAPERMAHLFEPFAEGATGTGLGLSIVHKIVSDHGGSIDVDSRPGEGTSFVIEIPQAGGTR